MENRGSQLDLSSDASSDAKPSEPQSGTDRRGRFLGIKFECCGLYARIYPNRAGDAYVGRCPKCMKSVNVAIGPEGGNNRFFTAS